MLLESPAAVAETPRRTVFPAAVFVAVLIAVCGITAYVGVPTLTVFGHDVFFFLDNGYRVFQGQVPHRDFQSAWGPLMYLMDAAGLGLSGLRPEGLGYANAVFGGLIAIWAWLVARRRLSPVWACVVGIFTVLLITAPFPLGGNPWDFGAAMIYNRYGFALLGIVIVECAGEPRASGALSTGAACALLAFLKISYAVAAVPLILIIGGWNVFHRRRLAALCAAAGLVSLLLLLYLRFDLADMLRDLAMAASGRSKSWKPLKIVELGFLQPLYSVPLVLLALVAGPYRFRRLLTVIAFLALGGFLLSTNMQPNTLPLNAVLAVVFADRFFRESAGHAGRISRVAVALLMLFCVAPVPLFSALSLNLAAREKARPGMVPEVRLDSPRGASLVFAPSSIGTETSGPAYVRALNDGIALLVRRTGPRDGVLTVDMMNPFNYLLDRPSPTGGLASGAFNYVISDAAHPSAERWAGNTRWVMARKYGRDVEDFKQESGHIEGIRHLYQPFLDEHFELVEETAHWRLYHRR